MQHLLHNVRFINIFFLFCISSWSQNIDIFEMKDLSARDIGVKVGLVLSGGGARGLAHIGVIKEIERAGIRIDYIGGTSMGGIIGGLYASGLTIQQIDSMFSMTNFTRLLQKQIPRKIMDTHQKHIHDTYIVTLPFDKFKLSIPKSFISNHTVHRLFSKILKPVSGIRDFKNLSIPFYCTATDINTGKSIILDKGYLPDCLIASSALPAIFPPMRIGERLLIDGAMSNNYPIEEMLKKDVDYIIGVDTQQEDFLKERIETGGDIIARISSFNDSQTSQSKVLKTDVLIKPLLKDISLLDFGKAQKAITEGKKSAKLQFEKLRAIALKQKKIKNHTILSSSKIEDSIFINNIILDDKPKKEKIYILNKLNIKPHKKESFKKISKAINSLIATGNYHNVLYEIIPKSTSEYDIKLYLEKNKKQRFLRMGLHYDQLYKTSFLANITNRKILFSDDDLSLDLILGNNLRYNLRYTINSVANFSFSIKSFYNTFSTSVFSDKSLSDDFFSFSKINFNSRTLTNILEVSSYFIGIYPKIGIEHKYLYIDSRDSFFKTRNSVFEEAQIISLFANISVDTYDNFYFPRKGFSINADIHNYFKTFPSRANLSNPDPYTIASLKVSAASPIPFVPFLSTKVDLGLGITLNSPKNNNLQFRLGGYGNNLPNNNLPFFGYDFLDIKGNGYSKILFSLDAKILKHHHLTLYANYANTIEGKLSAAELFSLPKHTGYAIGYAIETFLGPLEIKYAFSEDVTKTSLADPTNKLFFNLGFWF